MKRILSLSLAAAVLILGLAACGGPKEHDVSGSQNIAGSSPAVLGSQAWEYTNLTDETTRTGICELLRDKGISPERLDTFVTWVDDYNSRVSGPGLPLGFVPMEGEQIDYSGTFPEPKETEDGEFAYEANCRLTAFLLMGDLIRSNGVHDEEDTYLMFDLDAIDHQADFAMAAEDRRNFATLFNLISVEDSDTLESHLANIQTAWAEREIEITEDALSLVTVYLHDPVDQVRFVGHTGVLTEVDHGILFVEKYGPDSPFQVTRFDDRGQLRDYLLARPDLYGDGTELAPIVLENGTVMNVEC